MKKVIRLTEGDIRNMVKKTVTRIFKENKGNFRSNIMGYTDDEDDDLDVEDSCKRGPKRVRRGHLEYCGMKENKGNFRQRLMSVDDEDDDEDDDEFYDDDDDYGIRRMRRGSYYDD